MALVSLYLSTALTFLLVDAVMLKTVLHPLFEKHLGDALADPMRMGAAAGFYLCYIGGLLFLVSWPALRAGTALGPVALQAAVLGAIAYGTYEFTSYAIMRDWHWRMTVIDVSWGTVLTTLATLVGLWVTRALTS